MSLESSWSEKMPAGSNRVESIRSLQAEELRDKIFVHPSGGLELRQNLLPFSKKIEKLGNSFVEDQPGYEILDIILGTGENAISVNTDQQNTLMEHFSRGQYEDLPDEEKLSTADFELMAAGIRLSAEDAIDIPEEIESTLNDFEDIILTETGPVKQGAIGYNWQAERSLNLTSFKSPDKAVKVEQFFSIAEEIPAFQAKAFKILSKESLEGHESVQNKYFTSYSAAKDYLNSNLQEVKHNWQVMEVNVEEEEAEILTTGF